jgi:hypothetical protein
VIGVIGNHRPGRKCRSDYARFGLVRHRDHVRSGRHHLHDVEALVLEPLQKAGQGGDRLWVDVVKKQNPFAVRFKPLHRRSDNPFGADAMMPIIGDRIGRKNDKAAGCEFALEEVGSRQTGDAKERR